MALAVWVLSPVSSTTRQPERFRAAMAAALSGFTVSATASMPSARPCWAKYSTVLPSLAQVSA